MYYNHNLRTDLQEWKNRLVRADYNQLGHQLRYFVNNIESNKILNGIVSNIVNQYNFDFDYFEKKFKERRDVFHKTIYENDIEQASFCYQLLKYIHHKIGNYDVHKTYVFGDYQNTKNTLIDDIVTPIIYYFHDKLDKSNSIIYLLEKYKRRVEWFTRKELAKKYNNAEKEYENLLEEDLRLFLFDQGIDYPFSTPKSASGRGDIIGAIETDNPLIVEIKIVDKNKKYGIDRIKSGFHQIVKYTEDYSKDVGYLVIYNFDKVRYDFKFKENSNVFPPMLIFNNKVYYFIIIDMYSDETASKLGSVEKIEITEDELIKK